MSKSKPKIIADENVPRSVVNEIRNLGYKVTWIAENPALRGMRNSKLLNKAEEEKSILITCDSDLLTPIKIWKIIHLNHTGNPREMAQLIKTNLKEAIKLLVENKAKSQP